MSEKKINQDVFRAYDIRGIYPIDIDENFAELVGKAFGSYIGSGKRVLVGRDVRISSPQLSEHLVKGVLSQGVDIIYAGVIPTPLLYFAISHYKLDGGISVTASHNPPEWNGFKICKKNAHVIGIVSGMEDIQKQVNANKFDSKHTGSMKDRSGTITGEYLDFISNKVDSLKGLKIGIDPGNGAYSKIATETFKKKGATVFSINDVADGRFPSRSPEPKASTVTDLINLVKSKGLDMGVAFDGDGDRVLFVDEKASVVAIDSILALLVKAYLKNGEKVVYEVSVSSSVDDAVKEKGGVSIVSKVGHSYMKDHMKYENARLGGEISGHMYFQEVYGSDDALFAALKVSDMLIKSGKRLSELAADLPRYIKVTEELRAEDSKKFKAMDIIESKLSKDKNSKIMTVDGMKVFTSKGWFVLRASNTTPYIKCTAEAKNEKDLEELLETARNAFNEAYKNL